MQRRKPDLGRTEPDSVARREASPRAGKSSEYSDLAMKLAAAKRAHGIP
jgi:hypothetical protein